MYCDVKLHRLYISLVLSCVCSSFDQLWDLEKNVAYSHFHGHLSSVPACTFSNDMRLVATGGQDRSTKIFDTHTQHCLATLYENQGLVGRRSSYSL